jgi:hypothetical protein
MLLPVKLNVSMHGHCPLEPVVELHNELQDAARTPLGTFHYRVSAESGNENVLNFAAGDAATLWRQGVMGLMQMRHRRVVT